MMKGKLVAIAVALALVLGLAAASQAEPIGPGVTASLSIDPAWTSATTGETDRMLTLTNANASMPGQVLDIKVTVTLLPDGVPVELAALITSPPRSGEVATRVGMTVPSLTSVVSGSVKVNGVAVAAPPVTDGQYSLDVTIPAADPAGRPGVATVEDTLAVNLGAVARLLRVPVNTALLSTGSGWALSACAVGVVAAGAP